MTYIPEDHDVGYMLKAELTIHEPGFGSLFALTEFVVLGTKEPKAHVTIQSGFPLEGETLEASAHVVWCAPAPSVRPNSIPTLSARGVHVRRVVRPSLTLTG